MKRWERRSTLSTRTRRPSRRRASSLRSVYMTIAATLHSAAIAKSKADIAPVAGADPRRLRPEAAELKVGGGQKVETTTTAADSAQTSAKEAASPSDAVVPGALPEAAAATIPDWYRVGWSGQTSKGLLSQGEAEQSELLSLFVAEGAFANLFYSSSVIVFAVLATHYVTRLGGGWGMLIFILGICAKYQSLAIARFRHRSRDDMTREMAKTRLFTEVETVDWMNVRLCLRYGAER